MACHLATYQISSSSYNANITVHIKPVIDILRHSLEISCLEIILPLSTHREQWQRTTQVGDAELPASSTRVLVPGVGVDAQDGYYVQEETRPHCQSPLLKC